MRECARAPKQPRKCFDRLSPVCFPPRWFHIQELESNADQNSQHPNIGFVCANREKERASNGASGEARERARERARGKRPREECFYSASPFQRHQNGAFVAAAEAGGGGRLRRRLEMHLLLPQSSFCLSGFKTGNLVQFDSVEERSRIGSLQSERESCFL